MLMQREIITSNPARQAMVRTRDRSWMGLGPVKANHESSEGHDHQLISRPVPLAQTPCLMKALLAMSIRTKQTKTSTNKHNLWPQMTAAADTPLLTLTAAFMVTSSRYKRERRRHARDKEKTQRYQQIARGINIYTQRYQHIYPEVSTDSQRYQLPLLSSAVNGSYYHSSAVSPWLEAHPPSLVHSCRDT